MKEPREGRSQLRKEQHMASPCEEGTSREGRMGTSARRLWAGLGEWCKGLCAAQVRGGLTLPSSPGLQQ